MDDKNGLEKRSLFGFSLVAVLLLLIFATSFFVEDSLGGSDTSAVSNVISLPASSKITLKKTSNQVKKIEGDTIQIAKLLYSHWRAKTKVAKARIIKEIKTIAIRRTVALSAIAKHEPNEFFRLILPDKILSIIPSGLSQYFESVQTLQGILFVGYADSLKEKRSEIEYFLTSSDGKVTALFSVDRFAARDLISNTKISVKGIFIRHGDARTLIAQSSDDITILENPDGSRPQNKLDNSFFSIPEAHAEVEDAVGSQKVAVILVNFTDLPDEPWTVPFVLDFMNDSETSVKKFYLESSFGKLELTSDVFGWYTLAIPPVCDMDAIRKSAVAASDPDIYFPDYSRVVIMFPPVGCWWAGYATIGQTYIDTNDGRVISSISWIHNDITIVSHEMGHNLGLAHASGYYCGSEVLSDPPNCEIAEYGDFYDVMGGRFHDFDYIHPNAPHKEVLHWLTNTQMKDVLSDGTYTIAPIEKTSRGILSLRVPRLVLPDGSVGEWYYLEYREPIGFDSLIDPRALNASLVHYNAGRLTSNRSLLLDMTPSQGGFDDAALTLDTTYTDETTGVSFTPLEVTPGGLRVSVDLPFTTSCIRRRPSVTIIPDSQWGKAGDRLEYTLTVRNNDTPNCGAATYFLWYQHDGWFVIDIPQNSVTLPPGAAVSFQVISVTSLQGAPTGFHEFDILAVDVTDGRLYGLGRATYVVFSE